jgi:hypothetical protein
MHRAGTAATFLYPLDPLSLAEPNRKGHSVTLYAMQDIGCMDGPQSAVGENDQIVAGLEPDLRALR